MVGFVEILRIRRETDKVLSAYGVGVRVVMEFDNIETLKARWRSIPVSVCCRSRRWSARWSWVLWWRSPWRVSRWSDRLAFCTGAASTSGRQRAGSSSSCWTIPRRKNGGQCKLGAEPHLCSGRKYAENRRSADSAQPSVMRQRERLCRRAGLDRVPPGLPRRRIALLAQRWHERHGFAVQLGFRRQRRAQIADFHRLAML